MAEGSSPKAPVDMIGSHRWRIENGEHFANSSEGSFGGVLVGSSV